MKRFLFVVLLISSLSNIALSQTPSPSPSATITSQSTATPQPQATQISTSIKVSPTDGIVIENYPVWIIWVLIGVAVVSFVIWFFLLRSEKPQAHKPFLGITAVSILLILALVFSIGSWWGRRGARNELQQIVSRIDAVDTFIPQPTPVPASPAPEPWPFYMVMMGFALLLGLEAALFLYLILRLRIGWHWYRWPYRERFDEYEDWRSGVRRKFDSMQDQITELRYKLDRFYSQ